MMGEFSSGVLGDDEDRKPNIEYLDSLNEHNKRSRSVENEGSAERKQARVVGLLANGGGRGGGWGQGQENGDEHHLPMNGLERGSGVDAGDVSVEEDPIVYGLFFIFLSGQMLYSINLHCSGWQTNAVLPG